MTNYYLKYLKYKKKYLQLKTQTGGNDIPIQQIRLDNRTIEEGIRILPYIFTNPDEIAHYTRILNSFSTGKPGNFIRSFESILSSINTVLANENKEPMTLRNLLYCYSLVTQDLTHCLHFVEQYDQIRDVTILDLTLEPPSITLISQPDRTYHVNDGRHRVIAHILFNRPTIKAIIE